MRKSNLFFLNAQKSGKAEIPMEDKEVERLPYLKFCF
jgi:hypothetical protein